MNAAIATLAGLVRASRDGTGARIDVAMLDTQVSLLSYVATYYLTSGEVPGRQGRQHMSIPTYRAFTCGDGRDIVVTANTPRMWEGLCRALGVPELLTDERFADNDARRDHATELAAVLEPAALRLTSTELLDRLGEQSVASAPINTIDATLADPHVRARGMVLEQHRGDETIGVAGDPLKITGGRTTHATPPRLGENTRDVLCALAGYDPQELAALAESGVIPRRDPAVPPTSHRP